MRKRLKILLIEDDKYFRISIKEILRDVGTFYEAQNLAEARQLLLKETYDLIISDIDLQDGTTSLELIDLMKKNAAEVMILSSLEEDHIIKKVYELGAKHFICKNKIGGYLLQYVEKIIKKEQGLVEKFLNEKYLTQDDNFKQKIIKLLNLNIQEKNLLLRGETGTGKTLLAKFLHEFNSAQNTPFIHLNCSELSDDLLESELFGHQKGAFTGAHQNKIGKLLMAHNGTLFLDEIGTISMSMQQKLLKSIEEKSFYSVGGTTLLKSNFNLISATCDNLDEKISKGQFREDFFHRICGHNFYLPSLRERKTDIPLLLKHFLKQNSRKVVLSDEALEFLANYEYPGNIRELKKIADNLADLDNGFIHLNEVRHLVLGEKKSNPIGSEIMNQVYSMGYKKFIRELEIKLVKESLEKNNHKVTQVIKDLGISTSCFYRIYQQL